MRVRLLKNFRKVFHCHNFRMSNNHSFTFNNAVLVVDNLGQGSQAVGGAGGVGHNLEAGVILLVVDTHHKHGSISRGGRDNNLENIKNLRAKLILVL